VGVRTAYFREYYRVHRATWDLKDDCPDCGCPKLKRAKRCIDCTLELRRIAHGSAVVKPLIPTCLFCSEPMRQMDWHGQTFWRCGGCGLEAAA
jgi:ribosomal protein L37AE/L43A